MKRLKKVGYLILSALLATSVTACSSSPASNASETAPAASEGVSATEPTSGGESGASKEMTIWHIFANDTDKGVQAFKQALSEYQAEYPDITINTDETDNDAYKTKLKTALAANSAPDVFYSWGGGFSTPFVNAGLVLNLEPYVASGVINYDQMVPNICDNFLYNGELYGLPTDMFIGVLQCNQELFDQFNLEIPKTLDDLYAVSKVFNENGIIPVALGEKDKWPGQFAHGISAMRYGGVDKVNALLNGESGSFEDPYVLQSIQTLQEMVDAGVFSSSAVALTHDEASNDFRTGRAAMFYTGNWGIGGMQDDSSPLKGKVTLANWPSYPGAEGEQNSFIGGASASLMVSANTPYPDDAVNFAVYLSKHFSDNAYMNGSILPTWKFEGDESSLKDYQKTLATMCENADGFCLAWDTLLEAGVAQVHLDTLQGVYAKQITPEQYVQEMMNAK